MENSTNYDGDVCCISSYAVAPYIDPMSVEEEQHRLVTHMQSIQTEMDVNMTFEEDDEVYDATLDFIEI